MKPARAAFVNHSHLLLVKGPGSTESNLMLGFLCHLAPWWPQLPTADPMLWSKTIFLL